MNEDDGSRPAPGLSRPRPRSSGGSGISIVWVIPIVAAADRRLSSPIGPTRSKGPTITHQLRHRRGPRGRQDQAALPRRRGRHRARPSTIAPDLKHIVVTARHGPQRGRLPARAGPTFWIVKPRIGVGGVSGLGTLLSGAYIGLAPGEGEAARTFTGLEEPPPISANVPGREYVLTAAEPGLGQPGRADLLSRHRYRPGAGLPARPPTRGPRHHDLRPGAVPRAGAHDQPVLERQRHQRRHRRLRASTSRSASLQALLIGGIEFDTPLGTSAGEVAEAGDQLPAVSRTSARWRRPSSPRRSPSWSTSTARSAVSIPARRSSSAASRSGAVTSVRAGVRPRPPTRSGSRSTIEIEPQRLVPDVDQRTRAGRDRPPRHGRARQARPAGAAADRQPADRRAVRRPHLRRRTRRRPSSTRSGPVPVIPSVPATLEALQASATAIMNKIAALPLEQLVGSLTKTAAGSRRIVNSPELQRRLRAARAGHGAAAADHRPHRRRRRPAARRA